MRLYYAKCVIKYQLPSALYEASNTDYKRCTCINGVMYETTQYYDPLLKMERELIVALAALMFLALPSCGEIFAPFCCKSPAAHLFHFYLFFIASTYAMSHAVHGCNFFL
ncbi:hypothetical protein Dimus_011875 [Dionaea muscipula]